MQEPRIGYEYWPLDMERLVLPEEPLYYAHVKRWGDADRDRRIIDATPVGARWRVGMNEHAATWAFAVTELDGKPVFIHTPVRATASRVLY